VPDNLKKEIGHFNVFRFEDFVGKKAKPVPYSRKDYYKISLLIGKTPVPLSFQPESSGAFYKFFAW